MITNSIISGNKAQSGGGGLIFASNPTVNIVNTSIVGNFANNNGGGIQNNADSVALVNSVLWGNTNSGSSNQITNTGVLTIQYTGIEDGIAGIVDTGTLTDAGNNLTLNNSDTVFVDPITPLSAPTVLGDYHLALSTDNPVVNAASNTIALNAGLTTDIDGEDRVQEWYGRYGRGRS